MKIMAGVLEFEKGERKLGLNTERSGAGLASIVPRLWTPKTALQEVMDAAGTLSENEARGIPGSFLFRKVEYFQRRRRC